MNHASQGAIGLLATFGSFMVSFIPQLETCLRIGSLVTGIAVGVVTIYCQLRRK